MVENGEFVEEIVDLVFKGELLSENDVLDELLSSYEVDEVSDMSTVERGKFINDIFSISKEIKHYGYHSLARKLLIRHEEMKSKLRIEHFRRCWGVFAFIPVFALRIWNLFTGYGLSVIRVIISSFLIIYIYSFFYLGLNYISVYNTGMPGFSLEPIYSIYSYLYLSLLTFLPSGVNTIITPFNGWAQLLVVSEVILGYFFIISLFYIIVKRVRMRL